MPTTADDSDTLFDSDFPPAYTEHDPLPGYRTPLSASDSVSQLSILSKDKSLTSELEEDGDLESEEDEYLSEDEEEERDEEEEEESDEDDEYLSEDDEYLSAYEDEDEEEEEEEEQEDSESRNGGHSRIPLLWRLFGKNKNTTTQDPDPDIKEELVAKLKARLRNYLIFDRERRKQIHRLEREVRCLKERLERERGEMKRARDELMRRYITQQQFREREEELRKGTVIIRGLRDVDERLGRVQDEVRGLMGEKLPDW